MGEGGESGGGVVGLGEGGAVDVVSGGAVVDAGGPDVVVVPSLPHAVSSTNKEKKDNC